MQPDEQPGGLIIALLGGFRVAVEGRAIGEEEWQQRRAGDLVKLLALAPWHRLHAEQVMETLWPEADAEVAARNMQQALHRARRVLEPGLAPGGHSAYLQRAADQAIRLMAPGGVSVDVGAFLAARDRSRQTGATVDLAAAVERYTGDLLPRDAYADWTIRAREQLREAHSTLLAELAGRYEQEGRTARAVATWARLVEAEPAHEEARVALMHLHARAGRRYHALRQYQQLRQALRRELDTEPSDAAQRLYEALRAGTDLSPQPPLRRGEGEPDTDLSPQPPLRRGEGEADSPRDAGAGPGNRFTTSFIGRAREIEEVSRLLAAERLVTLGGAGGSGKTRLAERVALGLRDAYADGVWLVELAPLADGRLVVQTVAAALGIREEHGQPLIETLTRGLGEKELLLVLDNCEHLVAEVAVLAGALLGGCPRMRILATSRRPLHVARERVWRVPEMVAPDPDNLPPFERLAEYDAIRLFAARAAAQRAEFALTPRNAAAVVNICMRLDGLPLAIELAAARLRLLGVDEVAARLDDALALLANGNSEAVPRQRTLRAVLDWSENLLGAEERILLRRLAVFAGGWSLEAAEAICAGDGIAPRRVLDLLERLADASLVVVEERDGHTRHRLLEMVRRYAWERLDTSGEREAVSRRHSEWYVALAERAEPHFAEEDLKGWMERLDLEHANLRAVLAWATERNEVALGLRLVGAVWRYWYHRGQFVEGRRWLETFLAKDEDMDAGVDNAGARLARVKALIGLGHCALLQGDLARAQAASDEGIELARVRQVWGELAIALAIRGGVAEYRSALAEAESWYRKSLEVAQAHGDTLRIAMGWSNLADVARAQGRYDDAASWFGECLTLARCIKDTRGIAMSLTNVGHMTLLRGDARGALGPLEESLALFRELKDARGIGEALLPLGHAAYETGDRTRADACYAEGLAVFQASNHGMGMAHCLEGLAVYGERAPEMAVRLLAAAGALRETMGTPREPHRREFFERATHELRLRLGERAFAEAWAIGRALPLERIIAEVSAKRSDSRAMASRPARAGAQPAMLTRRQREVAALVVRGLTDKQIGDTLGMAERTASKHVSNILGKLGVSSREAIGQWWRAHEPLGG